MQHNVQRIVIGMAVLFAPGLLQLANAQADETSTVNADSQKDTSDATISLSPAEINLEAGHTAVVKVTLAGKGDRALNWSLSAQHLPPGVTGTFSPSRIKLGDTADLTLRAPQNSASTVGTYSVRAQAKKETASATGKISVTAAPVATFTCNGSDGPIVTNISGGLDASGRPVLLSINTSRVGAGVIANYSLARAGDVTASDPNAGDIATWSADLHMGAWDVTPLPANNPNQDNAYLFLPTGAQAASAFAGFSYVLLAGGAQGSMQITLDCRGSAAPSGRPSTPTAFDCQGNDGTVQETISGTFDSSATPTALNFIMAQSGFGQTTYSLNRASPVAASDPHAPEVASFASSLGMVGWDVTPAPADNPNSDQAYLLFPTGAQTLSTFPGFYYYVLSGGGSLQIILSCLPR